MNRRLARWFGPVLVVVPLLFLLAFGADPLTPTTAVTYLSLTVGGLLFVAAGYGAPETVGGHEVPWYVLAGLGDVSIGLGFAASGLSTWLATEPGGLFYAATAVLGGAIISYIGVDIARGGRHMRVETDPD